MDYLLNKSRAYVAQWIKKWKINKKHKHPCFAKKINYKELALVYASAWDAIASLKNFKAFPHANRYKCTSEWFAEILYELQLVCCSENPSGQREIVSTLQTKNQLLTDIKNERKDYTHLEKICNKKYSPHTYRFFESLCKPDENLDYDMNEMRVQLLNTVIKALKAYSTYVRRHFKCVIVPSNRGYRIIEGRGRGYETVPNLFIDPKTLAMFGFQASNDHFSSRL